MTRFILGLFAAFAAIGVIASGLDTLVVESRSDATVLQQLVVRLSFGFSTLALILSTGLFSLLGHSERVEAALKDIALSNSDAAKALTAILAVVEAPAKKDELATAYEKQTSGTP